MIDTRQQAPLAALWLAVGRRLAVIAAATTALVSLLHHVPVWAAATRGTAVLAVVWLVASLGQRALARDADAVRESPSGTRARDGTR